MCSQQYYINETGVCAWKCVCANAGKLLGEFSIFAFSHTMHKRYILSYTRIGHIPYTTIPEQKIMQITKDIMVNLIA